MSDVSAVVLSMGESYVTRAFDALAHQTHPVADVLVIENVSPFHRALNEAAQCVTTPYFLQVDADMIPDATCVAELRAAMDDRAGAVCGALRDPLMGQIIGIKLFRTDVVRRYAMRDTVAQDVNFMAAMERAGWALRYVGKPPDGVDAPMRTVGEHRPDYTPPYTFQKYLIEGRRYRYRGARGGLFWRLEEFAQLDHPLVPLAQVAQGHGFFLRGESDQLKPKADDPRAMWLAGLLESPGTHPLPTGLLPLERHARLRDVFRAFVDAGRVLGGANAGATIRDLYATIRGRRHDWRYLVAHLALGHGIIGRELTDGTRAADERALKSFVRYGIGRRVPLRHHVRARAEYLALTVLRRKATTPWLRSMVPW